MEHRNVFTRCTEGHQMESALTRGLPYISRRNGDKWSLENYAHGRQSHAEGWHKNLSVLWFDPLLEARAIPGPPGGGKRFEQGVEVQTISRAHWVSYSSCQEAEGEGRAWQDTSQRGGEEIIGEWTSWRYHRRGKGFTRPTMGSDVHSRR